MELIVDEDKRHTALPRILKASVHLFARNGVEGTSTREIARKADISEMTLFRYFGSKNKLAWHIFSVHLDAFSRELERRLKKIPGFKEKIEFFVRTCFESFETSRDLMIFLIVSEHREFRNFPVDFLHPGHVATGIIREGRKAGEFRDMDVTVAGTFLTGSVIRMCNARIYGRVLKDLRKCVEEVSETLWQAFKK